MANITFNEIDPNAAASAVLIEQQAKRGGLGGLLIPQKILLLGQFNSGKTPTEDEAQLILSPDDAANRYGLGSLLHIQAVAAFRGAGSVPVYAMPLGDGVGESIGGIAVTASGALAGEISLYIAGKRISVAVAKDDEQDDIETAIVAAINADPNLPVTAVVDSDDVLITAKWVGLSGNGITLRANLRPADVLPTGVTLVITDMTGGTSDPLTATALAGLGDTWYTFLSNPYGADATYDELEAAGVVRNAPDIRRQFLGVGAFAGTRAAFLTILDSRNSEWTSIQPVEGSPNLTGEIAAAATGVMARRAQINPGRPYRGLILVGILPGTSAKWTYTERDAVVKAGGSTFIVTPGDQIAIDDAVTTRTLTDLSAPTTLWRFAETVANLQAKIFSIEQVFNAEPFTSGVVVDDASITAQDYAIRPKTVKTYAIRLIDELWVPRALTKNRDAVVAGIVVEINSGNPNRIDVKIPDVFAAGLKILAAKLEWSFTPPVGA